MKRLALHQRLQLPEATRTTMNTERSYLPKAAPLYVVLVVMGLLATLVSQGQTATNACTPTAGNEYSVTEGVSCSWQTFNKTAAFTNTHEPNTCNSQNGATSYGDGWGWFTAINTTTTITFDPSGTERPILHVFTGTCGGTLTQVACNNSGSGGTNAVVSFTSVIGQVYLIRVQRHQSNAVMNGTICILSPKGTDSCTLVASNEFSVNSTCSFQPFNKPAAYTATFNPGTCGAGNFNESWGWFTATAAQTVLTYDPNGTERPILHVFSGACGSLTQVGCVDAGANGANAELVITTVAGQNYIVRIQRQGANTVMDGQLCVWSPNSTNACALAAQNEFVQTSTCTFQPFQKPEAYTSALNPGGCNSGANDDAWGWFTATSTSTVITFDPDLSLRPILHVFSGSCGSLTQLACHDGGANGVNAEVALNTVVGQNYLFRVQRQGSNAAMNGGICIWAPNTTNACAFSAQNQFTQTSTCTFQPFQKPEAYTSSSNPGGCNSGANDDAWGWFTATASTTIMTFDPDLGHRPILHVFSGTCGSLTQIACHDGGANGANAEVVLNTVVGQNYAFRVQRQGSNAAMDGGICIWTPPTTNICSYAVQNQFTSSATCNFQAFLKPESYTAAVNPGGCNSGNFDDAWGWFTATSTRTAITYDPDNNHRPVMHVFTGACGSLTQVACSDGGATGINAEVLVPTVIGQNYMVRIQRQGVNTEMNGAICIRAALANDDCGTPTVLPVLENCFAQTFSNDRATRSLETPAASCGGTVNNNTQQDVWFSFVAPGSGQVIIETTAGTLTAAAMQLYSGACGSLTAIECSTTGGPGNMPKIDRTCNPLTPGASYRIRLWGTNGDRGTFTICVSGPENFTARFEDCAGSIPVCSDQSINNNASSFGCTQDLNSGNRGCLASNERQGSWYTFTPSASGTLEFTITPNGDVDYDFAIWGPMSVFACPPAGTPIRCSYASPTNNGSNIGAGTYLTGLRAGNTDTSEPAYNGQVNGFVAPLDVLVGEVYVLYVDNFTSNGQSFALDWTLTNGCSLNCNVLPVELVSFGAEVARDHVALDWSTLTEVASSHFLIERSSDGQHFTPIGSLPAAGSSLQRRSYAWQDTDPLNGMGYYRLRQVDLDGGNKFSDVVSVAFRKGNSSLTLYPNPARDRITMSFPSEDDLESATVIVMDASGRHISVSGHALAQGQNSIDLSINHLDPGSYLVRLTSSSGQAFAMGRFVKE
jgi:hypothetical protein